MLRNLSNTARGRKQAVSMLADSSLTVLCVWAAWSLRAGEPFLNLSSFWHHFLLMPLVTVALFASLGVYQWVIRSTNQRLFKQLGKGAAMSSLGLMIVMFLLPASEVNPRSVFIMYGLLLFMSTCGIRVFWRSIFDTDRKGAPIAIYGAGEAGQQLVSLLNKGAELRPVLFIDDDPRLAGRSMYGLPVIYGGSDNLAARLRVHEVTKVVLAMPRLSSIAYHQKVRLLEKTDLPVLTMPSFEEIIAGAARVDEIRDISITDILGRTEVAPDRTLMGRRVAGKTVLVTGGGGSIGSELCRQVMKLGPEMLIILDNSEANLYHITEELSKTIGESVVASTSSFEPILGSVLDKPRMEKLMRDHQVDTVFHAAAYKHVPIVEAQPDQGVNVNVFGTMTVLDCAIAHGVSDFLLISTDKAVRPTNAMGASKRVAELVLQARASTATRTRISMVRFGNVLGSSGSVVPKFKRQILEGGPITLTHLDVTRYFMTIPEASQLVLQASAIAKGGDVFVLDMGEPVRIEDLATTMVKLYGKKLSRDTGDAADIDIVVEGLRPGEKLYEELFISDSHEQTEVSKISSTSELWVDWEVLSPKLHRLRKFAAAQDSAGVKSILMELAFLDESKANKSRSKAPVDIDQYRSALAR
ncbi:MAG: polysaccharide biosynthesis protein [Granulosicoccus sp.]